MYRLSLVRLGLHWPPCGFDRRTWVLIALVPGHCLLFYELEDVHVLND